MAGIGLGYVLTSSYFIMNVVAVAVYPVLRLLGLKQHSKLSEEQWLIGSDREAQVCTLIGFYLFLKWTRSCSWEHFFTFAFTYAKLGVAFLFYLISPRYFAYYLIFILVAWVVEKTPTYSGGQSMITKVRTREDFRDLIGEGTNDKSMVKHSMVIFTSPHSESCYFTFPMWAKMAQRYSTEGL